MDFKEEIKQDKFISPQQMAHLNLLYTANYMNDIAKPVFKSFGITSQQYNVLRILKGQHPEVCSAGDIKAVMIDKSPDLTRLIDRLLEKDFVTRIVCEENRRKLDIGITKKGLALIDDIAPGLSDLMENQLQISDKEANELSRLLDKLRD